MSDYTDVEIMLDIEEVYSDEDPVNKGYSMAKDSTPAHAG